MAEPNLNRNLAGYCGIYCGACDIYCLHALGQQTLKHPGWEDLPEPFRKHLPFGPSPVKCQGCRSDDVFAGCSHCGVRVCAKKRGIVDSCVECERYPCFRYGLLKLISLVMSVEKKLPHAKSRKAQRERMVELRVDPWLAQQDEHWRCPQCQARYSWYANVCPSCGKNLSALDRFAVRG